MMRPDENKVQDMAGDPNASTSAKTDPGGDVTTRMDFAEVFRGVLRYWKSILAITLIFALLAFVFAYRLQNYYVASTQILVDPEGSRYVEGELSNGQKATEAHALNQQFILTSTMVLLQVVTQEDLANDPEFGAAEPYEPRLEVRTQRALDALQKAVVATLTKSSFVVNLSVTTNDPQKSERIANAIAATYIQTRVSMNTGIVRQASNDLSAQLASLEQKVVEGDRAIQAYKATHNVIDVDGRPTVERQIAEANSEISRISGSIAENDSIASEILRAKSDKDYFRSMLDSYLTPTIVALRSRYHEALQQLSILEASLGSRHPAIANARARVQSAQAILDQQLDNLNVSLSRNAERLKNQRELLQNNLKVLQGSLNTNDSSMVGLRELERQLASDRAVYEAFLLRTRQLTGQEQTISENPLIISAASAPLEKAGPRRTLIIAGATILGFLIGAGLAVARDRHNPANVPVPGTSPVVASHSSVGYAYNYWAEELLAEAKRQYNYCVVIYSSSTISHPQRSILEIARAAAAQGKKTLLVDGAPNEALTREQGLSSLKGLQNSLATSSLNCDLYQFPGQPELKIISAGFRSSLLSFPSSNNNGGLINWLEDARQSFDLILIDAGFISHKAATKPFEVWADRIAILYPQNPTARLKDEASAIELQHPVRKILIPEADAA